MFVLQVQKKEKMSLSYRARVIDAASRGVPAEDVLRFVHPAHYLQVLKPTHEAYLSQAASDGLDFVKMLPLRSPTPARPASA